MLSDAQTKVKRRGKEEGSFRQSERGKKGILVGDGEKNLRSAQGRKNKLS